MKKLLPILFLTLLPVPAQAITWKEFWEPFTERNYYYYQRPVYYCTRRVLKEEYVPGNRWRSGYVVTWTEWERYRCYQSDYD